MLTNNLNTPSENEKLRAMPSIAQCHLPLNLSYSFGFDERRASPKVAQTSFSQYKREDHEAKLKSFMQNKQEIKRNSYNMLK